MNAKPAPTWQTKLTDALKRDPKKTGVLTVLAVVMAVLVGRTAVGEKANPAVSVAGPLAEPKTATDQDSALVASGKRDASVAMRNWLSAPPTNIGRNLFAVHLNNYPQLAAKPAHSANPADQEKSAQQEADELKEQETRTASLKIAAGQLKLQSTIMTATPQALINGELLKVGDVIAPGSADGLEGFRVVKIEPRRVFIGRDSVKLEIKMN